MTNTVPDTLPDELRVKGVLSKGYGQLAKIVMLDPLLTLEAKSIYAYFCSYCGGGTNTAFPGRDKIVHDLHVNKDTYYKHFKLLVSNGYISVEQRAGNSNHPGFHHNIYTIESFPSRFSDVDMESLSEAMKAAISRVLTTGDISSAGYGNVPKSVMTGEFSIQAKGIYAYLSTFTGQDFSASPSKEVLLHHLKISHNSANKYVGELIKAGYVSRRQLIKNGRYSGNIYYLEQHPDTKPSDKSFEILEPKFSDSQFSVSEPNISDTQNEIILQDNPVKGQILPEPIISDAENPERYAVISDTEFSDTEGSDKQDSVMDPISSDAFRSDSQSSDGNKPSVNNPKSNNSVVSSLNLSAEDDLDGTSEEANLYDTVYEEISDSLSLPYRYTQNVSLMTCAVKILTEWDFRSLPGFYLGEDAEFKRKLYLLFVESLSEMMCAGFKTIVKGIPISYSRVYDAVIHNYLSASNEFGSVDLGSLPDDVVNAFIEAGKNKRIINLKSYMKAIIWTVLQDNGLRNMTDTSLNQC